MVSNLYRIDWIDYFGHAYSFMEDEKSRSLPLFCCLPLAQYHCSVGWQLADLCIDHPGNWRTVPAAPLEEDDGWIFVAKII